MAKKPATQKKEAPLLSLAPSPDADPAPAEEAPSAPAAAEPLAPAAVAGPHYHGGVMHFSQLDLARYSLAQHRVLNARQTATLKIAERDRKRLELERAVREFEAHIAGMQKDIDALAEVANREQEALLSLQKEMENVYAVPFSHVSYDDQTGRILLHGEPVSESGPAS